MALCSFSLAFSSWVVVKCVHVVLKGDGIKQNACGEENPPQFGSPLSNQFRRVAKTAGTCSNGNLTLSL